MRTIRTSLTLGLAVIVVPLAIDTAPPATADCTGAGAATVCAQGDVRGGGPTPPKAYYPSYCADPWYCDDGWGVDIALPIRPGRPNRPGGGGGIGPRN